MFNELKKKINNPNILCLVFFSASIIIILERFFAFNVMIDPRKISENPNVFWSAFEYTLSFTLPLAGFAYFCASKYAQNRSNKIKAFVVSSILIILLFSIMLAQISSNSIWYLLVNILSPEQINNGFHNFENKIFYTLTICSIYLPIIFSSVAFGMCINGCKSYFK